MHVLVNQLGRSPGASIRATVRCTADESPPSDLELRRARTDAVVATDQPDRAGSVDDWRDWSFWTATLPAPGESGEYVVVARSHDDGGAGAGWPTGDDGSAVASDASDATGGNAVRSRPFRVEPDLARRELLPSVLSYFRVERCTGAWDRADRAAPFAGDREATADVRGGWYDASGDVSKYLSHLSYANYWNPQQIPLATWGLLDVADRLPTGDERGATLVGRAEAEARHGADYLVRAQDDAGYFYQVVFDGWSGDPEEREICAFEGFDGERTDEYEAGFRQGGGVAIAALARASRERPGSQFDHGEFTRETYRDAAVDGFDHLQAHNQDYLDDGTENLLDDYCALLAATELTGATGSTRHLEAAVERARSLFARQTDAGWFESGPGEAADRPFFHATDEGLPIVACCRFLEVLDGQDAPDAPGGPDARDAPRGVTLGNDSQLASDLRSAIRDYWAFELELTNDVVNPFGYARQYSQAVDEVEPRARFFLPHENETGYWWLGENARIASLASAALASIDALEAENRAEDDATSDEPALESDLRRFADDQLDWILGHNPFDVSMLEGVGNNPDPFVERAPQTPGGIVNGITAGVDDESDVAFVPDEYADDGAYSWRWSEQWLPHAAWFAVAVARQH